MSKQVVLHGGVPLEALCQERGHSPGRAERTQEELPWGRTARASGIWLQGWLFQLFGEKVLYCDLKKSEERELKRTTIHWAPCVGGSEHSIPRGARHPVLRRHYSVSTWGS